MLEFFASRNFGEFREWALLSKIKYPRNKKFSWFLKIEFDKKCKFLNFPKCFVKIPVLAIIFSLWRI